MAFEGLDEAIDDRIIDFLKKHDLKDSLFNRIVALTVMLEHWRECPNCTNEPGMNVLVIFAIKKLYAMQGELALMN